MAAPTPNYVHRARLAHPDELPAHAVPVHDADTFYLRLDLGTYTGARIDPVIRIRLAGIDCWEVSPAKPSPLDPGYVKGYAARDLARSLLEKREVTAATEKPIVSDSGETLGRTVARVWVGDDELPDLLRAAGYEKTK